MGPAEDSCERSAVAGGTADGDTRAPAPPGREPGPPAGVGIHSVIRGLVRRVARMESLDVVAVQIGAVVHRATRDRLVKNLVSGTWMGHPLHPLLSDLPIGCWSCAVAAEVAGGERLRDVADGLVLLGVASAVPTAVTGLADWSDTDGEDRRIGLVHAIANAAALVMYSVSLVPGVRRHRFRRPALRVAGLTAMTIGGYLGGHLTFGRAVGVDHTAFEEPPSHWTRIARASAVREGRLVGGVADRYDVLVYMSEGLVHALADRCSHAGALLSEGRVDGESCVVCPLHGSRFRLADGAVVRGPATAPQPAFDARIVDDHVEVRLRSDETP